MLGVHDMLDLVDHLNLRCGDGISLMSCFVECNHLEYVHSS